MDLGLKGLNCLVTGSTRGLGYATAMKLTAEGARVAINGRNHESLNAAAQTIREATGTEVLLLAGDVVEPDIPPQFIERIQEAWGGLDILISNTGGPPSGSFESFTDEQWEQAVNLVFLSHVRLIRAALPLLKRSQHASVLTVSSYSTKQPIPNLVLSNSARLATVGLTKSLALELGSHGIRFNSILPGWTETERIIRLMDDRARLKETSIEEETRKQAQESPLGRMGKPEEFANAAVFLASPAASYITGVMLNVDGGMYKGTF